jgi:hypothetical protein
MRVMRRPMGISDPWTYISSVMKRGNFFSSSTITTDAMTTTNANIIILYQIGNNGVGEPAVSDSQGNTWTYLGLRGSGPYLHMWYCVNPTTSGSHTFENTGAWQTFFAIAFKSNLGTPSADLDRYTNASSTTASFSAYTPTVNNSLIVTGFGNTYDDEIVSITPPSHSVVQEHILNSTGWPGGIAYGFSDAVARTTVITAAANSDLNGYLAVFKPS